MGKMVNHKVGYETVLEKCKEYVQLEQGDTNYEVAQTWVAMHWADPIRVAGGIRIIEETWNQGFYRFGIFDMKSLEMALANSWEELNIVKARQIDSYNIDDEEITRKLWSNFFTALKPTIRKAGPLVATAKALHVLIPGFFMAFDSDIAKKYRCNTDQPRGYINFQLRMAEFAHDILTDYISQNGGNIEQARTDMCERLYIERTGSHYTKTLAKILDEYNWMTRKDLY
jgi:hypothetical protein